MTAETLEKTTVDIGAKAFRLETMGETGILWFDLPGEKINKFSGWVMEELDSVVDKISAMSDLKRVLIASPKPGIFIAGADVEEFTQLESRDDARELVERGQRVFNRVRKLPQTTIVVIEGACMGGGTELALACDYRLMSDSGKAAMGLPEVKLGIFPAWGGTTYLPRLVGIPSALDVILTGRSIRAKAGKRMGLVDEILPEATALDAALKWSLSKKGKRREAGKNRIVIEGNPLARKVIFNKARAATLAKTGGHYPAPIKAIDVMELGFREGVGRGLEAEAREASALIENDVARNLIGLFFLMEDAKKWEGPEPAKIGAVGVLGAGLMGAGIAQTTVDKAGVNVRLKDIDLGALGRGMKQAERVWRKKLDRRRINRIEYSRLLSQITTTTDWSGFHHVDLVIEAVLEKLELKKQVLADFEAIAKDGAIFATNTSTIPITKIAEDAKHPEKVIGMHFFSPVDKMPLLEIITGEKTSPETLSTAVAFGKKMGKVVVVCKDGPGFIVNRILGPYMNEAGFMVEEGYAIDFIDRTMVKFGMPLGPLNVLDEVGIDVAQKAGQVLSDAYGDRAQASELIKVLVNDGRFGKKNGRGVYKWEKGKKGDPDPDVYKLVKTLGHKKSDPQMLVDRMILLMINEAARILDEGIAKSAGDVDLAMIMGTGFPPFRGGLCRYADDLGAAVIVEKMRELRKTYGIRFEPSDPLVRLAESGGTFYEAWAG
jgi:3-hydroxyacyl-CoA dehydrogenase/enoyl-CoA hydratase/3-hydroxybutyryl-CoA epimerase